MKGDAFTHFCLGQQGFAGFLPEVEYAVRVADRHSGRRYNNDNEGCQQSMEVA